MKRRDNLGPQYIQWHGKKANDAEWTEESRLVAFSLSGSDGGLYIAFNSSHLPTAVELPYWHGRQWQPLIDTGKVSIAALDSGGLIQEVI